MPPTRYVSQGIELELGELPCIDLLNKKVTLDGMLDNQQLIFAALHEAGCDLIMTRSEVDFKGSLRSGDRFVVLMSLGRESRLRFVFHQRVLRLPDRNVMLEARIIGTGLIGGRPGLPDAVQALMNKTC